MYCEINASLSEWSSRYGEMDDKKLLNGKFTFKSCVVQKKQASLLSENVNRQLAESKEVVGLPVIGNLTVHCF